MPRNTEQKIKLLVLYDILQKQTDEHHPMTTNELVAALEECGIPAVRKTIYRDIETLNRYGFEILCDKHRSNCYYVADRKFERPEIQVLLQAIGAAKFLTEKKTSVLTLKIAELLGKVQGAEMTGIVTNSGAKSGNEHIYYSIDTVTTALLEQKKLSFLYFDVDLYGNRTYRKNKERYEVNPLGMIYSGEYFYLICYHDKYCDTANYRIDKMDDVRVENTPITERKEYKNFNVNAYRQEIFSMYAGEPKEVEILFPREYVGIIRDRFGDNCYIVSDKDGYIVRTTIRVSKTFFAWLTTFEGKIKIKKPVETKEEFRMFIENIRNTL